MIAGEEEVAVEVPVGPSITMHNDNDNDNNNDTPTKTDTANEVAAVDESHMSQDSKTISDMNTDTNAANGEVVVQNNVVETIAADEPPTQTPSPPPSAAPTSSPTPGCAPPSSSCAPTAPTD